MKKTKKNHLQWCKTKHECRNAFNNLVQDYQNENKQVRKTNYNNLLVKPYNWG